MRADGEARAMEIGNQALFRRHLCQRRFTIAFRNTVQ